MIMSDSFVKSQKARDSEFTTNASKYVFFAYKYIEVLLLEIQLFSKSITDTEPAPLELKSTQALTATPDAFVGMLLA